MQTVVAGDSKIELRAAENSRSAMLHDWAAVGFAFDDVTWCDWIYREFDGERVPRPLLGRPSRHGTPYPERVSVSPDPADPFQLENFPKTLETAQHLLLVVSPNSGHGPMLAEYMKAFKAAGGEQRIIALVVKGEPASPTAEPAREEDREWLPKWLQWRFEGNRFRSAGREEPLVVDARLGVSSLSEVRMRLFAAMLEVPREELAELGVVARANPSGRILAAEAREKLEIPVPAPAPLEEEPEGMTTSSSTTKWLLLFCGIGALGALGFLAFAPAVGSGVKQGGLEQRKKSVSHLAEPNPSTVVVTMEAQALSELLPKSENPPPNPPANPPEPLMNFATSSIQGSRNPADAAQLEIATISARRDRLVREAESLASQGNAEEALEVFRKASEVAKDLLKKTADQADAYSMIASIQRRIGHFAWDLSSAAEGRKAFASARDALIAVQRARALNEEESRHLREIESLLHSASVE